MTSTFSVCCLIALLSACTPLDFPAGPDLVDDGGVNTIAKRDAGAPRAHGDVPQDDGSSDADSESDSDNTPLAPPRADGGSAPRDAGKQGAAADGGTPVAPKVDAGRQAPAGTPMTTRDAGGNVSVTKDAGATVPVAVDAGTPPVQMMSVVRGSAAKAQCSSYGKRSDSMCAGYYCGVTEAQIAAEMPADTLCGSIAAALTCENTLWSTALKCGRDLKSANATASDAELRPKLRECVVSSPNLTILPPGACDDCFLDAVECTTDECLLDCLAGDSKGCDTCRAKNNCDVRAIACAKLPSPF